MPQPSALTTFRTAAKFRAALRGTRVAARPLSRGRLLTNAAARRGSRGPSTIPCPGTPSRPAPFMGCAASSDRAERQRRARARGHSEASTAGLLLVSQDQEPPVAAWRSRGCKVAPEPEEQDESAPEPAMPGSPSFRYYCQKAATVDALVAEAEAADGEGSIRFTETSQAPKANELAAEDASKQKIVKASKPKQVTKWLRFRGLAIVAAAWCNLFRRHRSKPSTPASPAAAESLPPGPVPPARFHA